MKVNGEWEKVKSKFGKEEMTLSEFATFIAHEKGIGTLSYKAVNKYLAKICKMSKNKLTLKDFQSNNNTGKLKGKGIYKLKPEYHGILATLICSDFFDKRKRDNKIENIEETREQIYKNFDKYLDEDDLKTCKNNSPYLNMRIEKGLQGLIEYQLRNALIDLYGIDSSKRHMYMSEFLNQLVQFRKLIHINCGINKRKDKYTIENFLIHLLEMKVHGIDYKAMFNPRRLSYEANKFMIMDYNMSGYLELDTQAERYLQYVNEKINNREDFNRLKEKAEAILDLSNSTEKAIYEHLLKAATMEYLTDDFPQDELEIIPYFVEEITKESRERRFKEVKEQIRELAKSI